MALRTYGTVKFSNDKWVINAEPHVNMRLKDVFRQIGKGARGGLVITHTPQAAKDLEWFMTRYPLEISDEDGERLVTGRASYDTQQEDLERIMLPEHQMRNIPLAKPMRSYQAQAVEILLRSHSLLCGDDVGLGKTVVGIGAMAAGIGTLPALVICQTHLPAQWKEKIEEFAPNLRVHTIKTRRMYSLPEADVYLLSYSKMIGWGDIFAKDFFKLVVYDEVQELRRTGTEKYRGAQILADHTHFRLGLSATPIYNYGGEIFAVSDILRPGALGSHDEFVREWGSEYNFGGDDKTKIKDPKALGAYLREIFLMVRRTREEVGRELPPVNKIIADVEYNEAVAEKAKKELKVIAARVLEGSFTERGQAARMLDSQARMMTGIAKASGVSDYVKILLENGEKVLLVGWHREVYRVWLDELAWYKPVLYTGTESPVEKEANRKKFMDGESKLMIMSLRSGVGLDGLQESCNVVVFGELDWSPQVHEQVIGRLRRDGQNTQVTAIFLTTDNGTDPLMIDVLGLKASQSHGILNPSSDDILQSQVDENRLKVLARNILERS